MENAFRKKKNHFCSCAESANPPRSVTCTRPALILPLCTAATWAQRLCSPLASLHPLRAGPCVREKISKSLATCLRELTARNPVVAARLSSSPHCLLAAATPATAHLPWAVPSCSLRAYAAAPPRCPGHQLTDKAHAAPCHL
jgi:hypothetical protein